MKIFKKLAILAMTTVFAAGMISLAACGNKDGDGVEVSDSEWSKFLNIDIEKYDSVTITRRDYYTYGKEDVDEWGEWEDRTETTKVDNKNQILYKYDNYERWVDSANDGEGGFVTETREEYYLSYKGAYYNWYKSSYNYNEVRVEKITKADFTTRLEWAADDASILQMYASMKQMFKYNKDTGMYEMSAMGSKLSIQFSDNGDVKMIAQDSSIEMYELSVSNTNSTTISVPKSVYDAIDAYIAEQAAE